MMAERRSRLRLVMDWRAAIVAGLVAGLVFLLIQLLVFPLITGGSAWIIFNEVAALVFGYELLMQGATPGVGVIIVAILLHFVFAVLFALLIAFVLHEWGLWVGIVGGALFGLALYAINYYALTALFPWFAVLRSWPIILAHVVYGAVAGGVYEALEHEVYVPVESEGGGVPG